MRLPLPRLSVESAKKRRTFPPICHNPESRARTSHTRWRPEGHTFSLRVASCNINGVLSMGPISAIRRATAVGRAAASGEGVKASRNVLLPTAYYKRSPTGFEYRLLLAASYWPPATVLLAAWQPTIGRLLLVACSAPPTADRLILAAHCWPPTTGRRLFISYD